VTQDSSSAHDPGCQCEQCTEAQVTDASVPVSSQPAAVSSRQNPSKTAPPSDRTLLAEQEVFRHLNDHVTSEAEFISAYKELAAASSTPEAVRYLISLVLEDEERHHRLLHEIVTAIENRLASGNNPDAVPDLTHEPPDRALEEVTDRFLAAERADAKQLKALRKELRPFRDTSMWPLLVELMEHDTAKHIRLLTYMRDHVVRQPRRYLQISRALELPLEESAEPQ